MTRLRLYADLVPEIPDRILYFDEDVLCRRDCSAFYYQMMEGREIAGVFDYYGKWIFRENPLRFDYLNSGVLLLNRKVRYTVHVLDTIYPDPERSVRENSMQMMKQDYEQKVKAYERAYGKKLSYEFEEDDVAGWISTGD